MKATIERATLLKSLGHVQSVVERRNTIPILVQRADRGEGRRLASADGDRPRPAGRRERPGPGRAGRRDHRFGPHLLRHRPQAARRQPGRADRGRGQDAGRCRAFALQPFDAAARRFPGDRRGRIADPVRASGPDASPDHRQDALCDFERRDALLSDGHLPACRRREAEGRGHRRPSPGPRDGRQARGRRRHAGRDHSQEVRWRTSQAAGRGRGHGRSVAVADQGPLRPRQCGPHQQADRRHLPRLQPGHSDRQRQASEARSRRASWKASTASRPSPAKRPAR